MPTGTLAPRPVMRCATKHVHTAGPVPGRGRRVGRRRRARRHNFQRRVTHNRVGGVVEDRGHSHIDGLPGRPHMWAAQHLNTALEYIRFRRELRLVGGRAWRKRRSRSDGKVRR